MSTTFFADPGVVTDLLAVCRAEGLLNAKTEKKVHTLLDQGLHPEQALIGTGLVPVNRYGEVVEQVFGVPFIRISRSSGVSNTLIDPELLSKSRAVLVEHRPKAAIVAFADPSDKSAVDFVQRGLREKDVALTLAVTLWSDLRSRGAASHSIGSRRRFLQRAWDRSGVHAFELSHGLGRDVHVHAEARDIPSFSLDSSHLSALALHLDRKQRGMSFDWDVNSTYLSHGVVLSGRRRRESFSSHHPLGWSKAFTMFFKQPRGVLVCVGMDALLKGFFRTQPISFADAFSSRRAGSRPVMYDLARADQEEVLHAVVAGRPILLVSSMVPVWLSKVASIGLPVHVLERHVVPSGMSWSSYSL